MGYLHFAQILSPMTRYAVLILTLTVFSSLSFGHNPAKRVQAVRTQQQPVVDGLLTESEWQEAAPVLDFLQYDPHEGGIPTELTSVRILYDDNALYVGVICYDSRPELLVHQLTRRDRPTEADRFTVQIDSYHDHHTAFVFSVNVSGVQSDGFLSQGGVLYDNTWDAVWAVATKTHPDGWSAEFEIPYSAFRFTELDDEEYEWGINFRRYIGRKRETVEWVMVPRSETLLIPKWGHLTGVRDIQPPLHLNLLPFISGRTTFPPGGDTRHDGEVGIDLKYGISRDFTLDAAINPDYGQVEVDQAILNLTVFESRFPEKRPFFIEGSHFFSFGTAIDNTSLPLFFSRRIGKRPGAFIPVSPDSVDVPVTTTILGAAKLSGHSASGLALGIVSAVTEREEALLVSRNRSRVTVEPRASYNALRVRQDLSGNSWVGGMATLTAREDSLAAVSGGVDWSVRAGEGVFAIDGHVAGTRASRNSRRNGAAGKVLLSRLKADHWFYTTSYDFFTRNFDPNDIGFFAQPRDHGGYVQLLYRENFAGGMFRRYVLAFNPEYRWNWDGVLTHAAVHTSMAGEYRNFWLSEITYSHKAPAYDDQERGLVGTYRRPATHVGKIYLLTDERQSVSGSITTAVEVDAKRKRMVSALLGLKVRPAAWVELQPLMYYQRTRGEETGVFSGGTIVRDPTERYSLFATRDFDEVDVALRGIVTFTRSLSLQFYSQVLLARGRYTDFRQLTSSTVLDPVSLPGDPTRYDFNLITFNANVLLRWEYLPGSALYLVWTQGRFDYSQDYFTGFKQRFGDTFSLPHEDVLLLKVSYYLPL